MLAFGRHLRDHLAQPSSQCRQLLHNPQLVVFPGGSESEVWETIEIIVSKLLSALGQRLLFDPILKGLFWQNMRSAGAGCRKSSVKHFVAGQGDRVQVRRPEPSHGFWRSDGSLLKQVSPTQRGRKGKGRAEWEEDGPGLGRSGSGVAHTKS